MAHEIYESDAMVYRKEGGTPWHKIGVDVPDGLTATEGMKIKNAKGISLDWELEKQPLYAPLDMKSPAGNTLYVPSKIEDKGMNYLVRSDNNQALCYSTDGFEVFQNQEQASLCDRLIERGAFQLETCGSLKNGRIVWFLGKLGKRTEIIPNDFVDQYVFCYTAHDGSSAFRLLPTNIRVVCNNTATYALNRGQGQGISIRHSKNMRTYIDRALDLMGMVYESNTQTMEAYKAMAKITLKESQITDFAKFVATYGLKNPKSTNQRVQTGIANKTQAILSNIHTGVGQNGERGIKGIEGTAWAAFNGMTQWVNFERSTKGQSEVDRMQGRLVSLVKGSGSQVIAASTDHLLALA